MVKGTYIERGQGKPGGIYFWFSLVLPTRGFHDITTPQLGPTRGKMGRLGGLLDPPQGLNTSRITHAQAPLGLPQEHREFHPCALRGSVWLADETVRFRDDDGTFEILFHLLPVDGDLLLGICAHCGLGNIIVG